MRFRLFSKKSALLWIQNSSIRCHDRSKIVFKFFKLISRSFPSNLSNQSPFIIFNGLKDHEDGVIKSAQEFIEQNYSEKLTVEQLADRFSVTRRTFERRFKKATRHTVVEYIQRVKTEATKKQLEVGRKTISEIMHDVGNTDTQTFRDVFRKITGMSHVDYRNKYNREINNNVGRR